MSRCQGKTRTWDVHLVRLDGDQCYRCGSYGPARIAPEDADRIAIEIEAARIVFSPTRTPDEEAGWLSHSYDAEHEHDETVPYLAGWLARHIYAGDEEPL